MKRGTKRALETTTKDKSATKKARVEAALSDAQSKLVARITTNLDQSVFITGPGGCGKSVVVRALVSELDRIPGRNIVLTATTGLAAVDIGGITISRFAGLGIEGDKATPARIQEIAKQLKTSKRRAIKRATDLVIEEISMMSAKCFDNLDALFRAVRGDARPMGGLRLILVGDFYQLPPVAPNFAFEAAVWQRLRPELLELTQDFRHADSDTFTSMLREIRVGRLTPEAEATLSACAARVHGAANGRPTVFIYPKNAAVDAINKQKLQDLAGPTHVFDAEDSGPDASNLFGPSRIPERLELKTGAQVMLTRNITFHADEADDSDDDAITEERTLANGMVGRIVAFDHDSGVPIVDFGDGMTESIKPIDFEIREHPSDKTPLATRRQLPLQLSYAISAHKSQGQTITANVETDFTGIFAAGQAYVVLSRVKSIEQLRLRGFARKHVWADPRVAAFYAKAGV